MYCQLNCLLFYAFSEENVFAFKFYQFTERVENCQKTRNGAKIAERVTHIVTPVQNEQYQQ